MKRILSTVLAIAMCVSLFAGIPVSAAGAATEYVYDFCPQGIDSSLYNVDLGDTYKTYGATKLNPNWEFFAESTSNGGSNTGFNGMILSGSKAGEWFALKLRIPTKGTYSMKLIYATHKSYNKGEAYLVPAGTSESDYFNSEYKLCDTPCNSSSSNVSTATAAVSRTVTATADNEEFIFILRRSSGYSAPVLIRQLIMTKEADEEEEPVPQDEYTYQFRYAEVGDSSLLNAKVGETYTDYKKTALNENWKFVGEYHNSNAATTGFNGIEVGSYKASEWLALKLRIPTPGTYSLEYFYSTHSSYGVAEMFLAPGNAGESDYFKADYKIADVTHKTASSNVAEASAVINKKITTTKNNEEVILIIRKSATNPDRVIGRRLVLTREKEEEPEPERLHEYLYQFRYPEVGDSSLYDLHVLQTYTSYGNTKLNENWMAIGENQNSVPATTGFNGITLGGYKSGEWLALKLRVPTAGTYSLDYFYSTHKSYNKGEIYLAPGNTAPEDYFKAEYKLSDVHHNSSSSNVEEKQLKLDKRLVATENGQEFIFIIRRKDGYSAPVVARRLVLTREPEYNFCPVGIDSELYNKDVSDNFKEYGSTKLNPDWCFFAENTADNIACTTFNGLKLSGVGRNEWIALKIMVPKKGLYAMDFSYATHSSYTTSEVFLVPVDEKQENYFDAKYKLSDINHKSGSSNVAEESKSLDFMVANAADNSEYLLIVRSSGESSDPIVFKKLSLSKLSDAGFELATKNIFVSAGESEKIVVSAAKAPAAACGGYGFSSADSSIAEVLADGTVNGKKAGKTTVSVNVGGGLITDTVNVTVVDGKIEFVDSVKLALPEGEIYPFSYAQVKVSAFDALGKEIDLTPATVTYASSDTGVAEIDDAGRIRTKKAGSTEITASVSLYGITRSGTATFTVTDMPAESDFPAEISAGFLNPYTEVGSENRIIVTAPDGRKLGGGIEYTYEIADPSVISEKDGFFKGLKIGKTAVKVTAKLGDEVRETETVAIVVGENLLVRKGVNHGEFENGVHLSDGSSGVARNESLWAASRNTTREVFDFELIRDVVSEINGDRTNIVKMSMDAEPTSNGGVTKVFRMQGSIGQYVASSANHNGFIPANGGKLYEMSGYMKSANTQSLNTAAAGTIYYYNGAYSSAAPLVEFRSTPWAGKSGDQDWTLFNVPPVYMNWDKVSAYSLDPRFDAVATNTKGYDLYLSHFSLHEVVFDSLTYELVGSFENAKTYDTVKLDVKALSNTGNAIVSGDPKKLLPFKFESSNPTVAKVSEDGTITAISDGEATITASITIAGKTESIEVPIELSGLEVIFDHFEAEAKTALKVDETSEIETTLYNTDGSIYQGDAEFYYESADTSVVTVSQDGVMTAKRTGVTQVTVFAMIGSRTEQKILEVTVSDETPLASASINGKTSVEMRFDIQLEAVATHVSGNSAYIPTCDVKFALADPSQSNILTVTEDGLVKGVSEGVAAVVVTVSANGTSVTSAPFEISVTPIEPKSNMYDFRLRGAAAVQGAVNATIEQDGFEINQEKTSPYVVNLGPSSFRFLYYGIQSPVSSYGNSINADTAIDIFVNYDGYYDMEFMGGQFASGAGVANLYMDGTFIGDYCFYDAGNNTANGPVAELNSMYLTRGIHTFTIRTMEKGGESWSTNQYPAYLKLDIVDSEVAISEVKLDVEKTSFAVGESGKISATAMMSNNKAFRFGLRHGNKEDTESYLTITSSEPNVIAYENGKLVAKSVGEAEITVTAKVYGNEMSNKVTVSVTEEKLSEIRSLSGGYSLYRGESAELELFAFLDSGREISLDNLAISYNVPENSAINFNNGAIYAKNPGEVGITVSATLNGVTKETVVPIEVKGDGFAKVNLGVPSRVMKLGAGGFEINVRALDNRDKAMDMSEATISFESSNTDIIEISEIGFMTPVSKGYSTVTVTVTINGVTRVGELEMSVRDGKAARTYYTDEKVEAARENIAKYSWAKSTKDSAVKLADKYLPYMESVYKLIHSEGIPRSYATGFLSDPEVGYCRYCGYYVMGYGQYPWKTNALTQPWKVQCPNCQRRFPSNDFTKFYELGLNEKGEFSRELALEKHAEMFDGKTYGYGYLRNDLYPELRDTGLDPWKKTPITHGWDIDYELENPADVWGVDDGFGYNTGRTYANGVKEMHTYVACFSHVGIWFTLDTSKSEPAVRQALTAFRDAYIYTGDEKYGRAGAILLDRFADFYPNYDLYPYNQTYQNSHGGDGLGSVIGSIWESVGLMRDFMTSYDAFFPMYDDPQVIKYISEKAAQYGLDNTKTSGEHIRQNIETNVLERVYENVKNGRIDGNFGMDQNTLAVAAVVLDREEKSQEIIDFIMQAGEKSFGRTTGGNVIPQIISTVDRDGYGTESSIGYNQGWASNLIAMADVLADYTELEDADNVYKNPKFIKMMQMQYPFLMAGAHAANIGDNGGTAGVNFSFTTDVALAGYKQTKLPLFAQILYYSNNNSAKGLKYNIFTKNPESIEKEIEQVINEYGELDISKSMMLTGFGLAVLRDGKRYKAVTSATRENTLRDWWIYFGGAKSHKHNDMLNLGIDAFGLNMAPDLGYPAETGGSNAGVRNQWVAGTISHNTVVVNESCQASTKVPGNPLHFDAAGAVKVIDIDAPHAYPNDVSTYRRTLVTVDVDDSVSYAIDFFRVVGGYEHVYSFHSQSIDATVEGVDLIKQPLGTYAGAGVPLGETTNYKKNGGYNWLDNVQRAINPGTGEFTADFKMMDYYKLLTPQDWHLKMTMLNDFELADVTLADGHPPKYGTNPESLKYVLAKRTGKDLDTLFTTVLEPYIGSSSVASLERVSVSRKDGDAMIASEPCAAVKVELVNGRIDYVVYAANKSVTYTIDGKFDFAGTIGVYTVDSEGNTVRTYLLDGTQLGEVTQEAASVTGTVVSFTDELSEENYIDVTIDAPVEAADLIGKIINIENDGALNGSYYIESASIDGNTAKIGIGDVTLIRSFADDNNRDAGYIYNIANGAAFDIPLSTSQTIGPAFEQIGEVSATAGSEIRIPIKVINESGKELSFDTSKLPRGMIFDEKLMALIWTPNSAQVGDNHIALTVNDGALSDTIHFIVSVYGATGGGGGSSAPSTPGTSTPTIPATKPEDKGNASSSTDNVDKTPSVGDADSSLGEEAENVRFVDLGNHAWAADAINALADEGIIKGTSENTFSPAANITRADFAILLVRAFKLASESEENFADVLDSDYFAKELAVARNTGLVNGIGENKFAPRNNITRQDMMVIVYRALVAMEKEFDTTAISASDFANVADYAKDAVSALVNAKLVNGKNGLIDPTAYTTRAEVAVLIQRILNFVK